MSISRRNMLIGSGLALTLAGSAGAKVHNRGAKPRTAAAYGSFEDGWNQGNPPWDRHPSQEHHDKFDPSYTAILYMEFAGFGLHAKRVHFPAPQGSGANHWINIKPQVVAFLEFLNGEGQQPGSCSVFPGLNDFAFDRPHHFIIYIKNAGVDYLEKRPIWFGKNLIRGVKGVTMASKNESFFDAKPDSALIKGGSDNLVYIKNYYHVGNGNGQNHKPINRERLAYALKINALMASTDDPTLKLPLLIDPDTGNMGEGQPPPIRPGVPRP